MANTNGFSIADLNSTYYPSDNAESFNFNFNSASLFRRNPYAPPPSHQQQQPTPLQPLQPTPTLQPPPQPTLQPTLQPSPPNSNSGSGSRSESHQHHPGRHHLPSLPNLFAQRRQFPESFEPFQLDSFLPSYRHLFGEVHQSSSPTSNSNSNNNSSSNNNGGNNGGSSNHSNNHGYSLEGLSWASDTSDFSFPRPNLSSPSSRRPESQHYAIYLEFPVSSPRTQQPAPSASFTSPSTSPTHITHTQLPQPSRSAPEPNSDDYYLATLANGNFSSPSLPPINSSPLPPTRPRSSNLPRPLEVGEEMPITGSSRSRTSKTGLVDLTKEEPDFESCGIDPTTPTMPAGRKRNATAALGGSQPPASKRRRSSRSSPSASGRATKSRRKDIVKDEEVISPFGDDVPVGTACQDGHDTIDLSNATEVPTEFMAPKVDNRIKIGKFQCVICMDDAAALTVTHCGHLFCSECLHSALHIDGMKKTCPVCRTKVDTKEKKGKNLKSYYHLELKIMTANKKGKRPAGHS